MQTKGHISVFSKAKPGVTQSNQTRRLLIVSENHKNGKVISQALEDVYPEVKLVGTNESFEQNARRFKPDLLVIEINAPTSRFFHRVKRLSWESKVPIAMFSETSDSRMIDEATDAGVNAFVVKGLDNERIQVVAELAQSRFTQLSTLGEQLQSARSELADRKIVEKAKGILMRQKNVAEDEAYHMLRKMAMKQNTKLVSVARKLISVADLLK